MYVKYHLHNEAPPLKTIWPNPSLLGQGDRIISLTSSSNLLLREVTEVNDFKADTDIHPWGKQRERRWKTQGLINQSIKLITDHKITFLILPTL